jgi:hypothetical protein
VTDEQHSGPIDPAPLGDDVISETFRRLAAHGKADVSQLVSKHVSDASNAVKRVTRTLDLYQLAEAVEHVRAHTVHEISRFRREGGKVYRVTHHATA